MNPQEFEQLIKQKAKQLQRYVELGFPKEAGNTALRFIDGNFRAQGWQGASFSRWKPNKRKGRILIQKGHLRNASYYVTAPGMATVRNTRPQAKIQNEGGTINIPVTKKMRKFAWAMYYKNGGTKRLQKNASAKRLQAEKWKGLAMTKKTFLNIKIDQRQFAPTDNSPSPVLTNSVERGVVRNLKQIF